MTGKYALGIDLGTTHSALSYFSLAEGKARGAGQPMLPVPQLTAPGTVESKQLLPSFLYLPNAAEFPAGSLALPWDKKATQVTGELARTHGAKVPARLVSSAKSWLCHPGVDRRGAILPWAAPEEVQRVSPLEASARYLEHLREAWDQAFKKDALKDQEVIVTVPASFDAGARDLTLEAAKQAGLGEVTLLEEPQAALYAWLEAQGDAWRKVVKPGEVILVIDVGGGTSDFSLISVAEQNGELALERLAVGDHILLGGDNMDLALAHAASQKLKAKLDAWQLNALTYACRAAKELLFNDPKLDSAPITVASRGSSLMGGTLKTTLER
ncbi:MAG: Hsp70 family protein, partial [Myxococcaceae bacterium]|nr:Hsp70 family protein [Myxococcaceae bacterium]